MHRLQVEAQLTYSSTETDRRADPGPNASAALPPPTNTGRPACIGDIGGHGDS